MAGPILFTEDGPHFERQVVESTAALHRLSHHLGATGEIMREWLKHCDLSVKAGLALGQQLRTPPPPARDGVHNVYTGLYATVRRRRPRTRDRGVARRDARPTDVPGCVGWVWRRPSRELRPNRCQPLPPATPSPRSRYTPSARRDTSTSKP